MSDPRPARDLDKIILRLPDGLRERLGELARVNGRSANAEAVKALEAWLLPHRQVEPAFMRLTDELWDKAGRAAARNKRGIVEEIIARLEVSFADPHIEDLPDNAVDLRAEIREAMHEAVEGLLADPERLRRLGYAPPKREGDDDPISG